MKMIIGFDKEKAKSDSIAIEQLYGLLDKRFTNRNLRVFDKGVYIDNGKEDDLFSFMVLASALAGIEWFVKYIDKWIWYEDDETPEDLVELFELNS